MAEDDFETVYRLGIDKGPCGYYSRTADPSESVTAIGVEEYLQHVARYLRATGFPENAKARQLIHIETQI